jgi:hypothetical protein
MHVRYQAAPCPDDIVVNLLMLEVSLINEVAILTKPDLKKQVGQSLFLLFKHAFLLKPAMY